MNQPSLFGTDDTGLPELQRQLATINTEMQRAVAGWENAEAMIATMHRKMHEIEEAIDAGGFDLSPCGTCGRPVICVPDGLPCCRHCAAKEAAEQ